MDREAPLASEMSLDSCVYLTMKCLLAQHLLANPVWRCKSATLGQIWQVRTSCRAFRQKGFGLFHQLTEPFFLGFGRGGPVLLSRIIGPLIKGIR